MTNDSLWGAIDESGDCVVKPEYCSLNDCGDGKFIGVNVKYKKDLDKKKKDKVKISVISESGKVLFDFSADKYENIHWQFSDGKLAVSVKKDGKESWGIINDKGETILKPSQKLKSIGTINDDLFTYNNGEGWGLMNIKGETLIRAKYEFLYYDYDALVAVVKNGDDYDYVDYYDWYFTYVGRDGNTYDYIEKNQSFEPDEEYTTTIYVDEKDNSHSLKIKSYKYADFAKKIVIIIVIAPYVIAYLLSFIILYIRKFIAKKQLQ